MLSDVGAPLVGARDEAIEAGAATRAAPTAVRATIGDIVGAFKSRFTVEFIRGVRDGRWPAFSRRVWQRNYYEHVSRIGPHSTLHRGKSVALGIRSRKSAACRDVMPTTASRDCRGAPCGRPRDARGRPRGPPLRMDFGVTPPSPPSPQSQPAPLKFQSRPSAAPPPSPTHQKTPPSYPAAPARPRGAWRYRRSARPDC